MNRSSVFGVAVMTLVSVVLWASTSAFAQTYPTKPITIVVSLAAGTGMDTIVRAFGEGMSQRLGRPVVVENKPGAAQNIASAYVAAAAPDGYTLLVASAAPMAVNPTTFKQLAYDPQRDFVPLALYARTGFLLVTNPALQLRTIEDLIAYAKKQPTPLSFGAAGVGGLQNLTMELFRQKFDLKLTNVPYRNSPQSLADVAAGHINLAIAETGASLPLIRSGKLHALAVTSAQRIGPLPDVPAVAETRGASDFEAVSWHVLVAPARTPKDVVAKLHEIAKAVTTTPEMKTRIANLGLTPVDVADVEAMQRYMLAERNKWAEIARRMGLEGSQ